MRTAGRADRRSPGAGPRSGSSRAARTPRTPPGPRPPAWRASAGFPCVGERRRAPSAHVTLAAAMLLALDIGNTNLAIGLFELDEEKRAGALRADWRLDTRA